MVNRITDLLAAGSCGINVELIGEVVSVDQVLENVLRHGAAAEEVIVANQNGIHNENPESKKFCYRTGALEESFNNEKQECILYQYGIREHVCEILEGGKDAFRIREQKYNLSE